MNVLIVEDDPISGLVLSTALEDLGHAATIRNNGQDGWQLLQQERFDLVITDWMMPKMDGIELCRQIRGLKNASYTYVILLTVRGLPDERLEALDAGADDFLIKPLDPAELVARMEVARRILSMKAQLNKSLPQLHAQNQHLGEVLVSQGMITPQQLSQMLDQEGIATSQLATALLERGWANDEQVTRARSIVMDVPYIDLDQVSLDPFTLTLIPHRKARQYQLIPLSLDDDPDHKRLRVAMADPWNIEAIDWVQRETRRRVEPLLASETAIQRTLRRAYHDVEDVVHDAVMTDALQQANIQTAAPPESVDTFDAAELMRQSDQAPVIRFVNTLLADAVYRQASDIHLQPSKDEFQILYRIDGQLQRIRTAPASFLLPVASRLKIMADLDISEHRLPQDGHMALVLADKTVDMRFSTLPTQFGERVVIRILDRSAGGLGMDHLGLSSSNKQTLATLINKPHGIVLVTGPTGSGKTTTLYAALNALIAEGKMGRNRRNIITCEDPIEYQLDDISQSNVNEKAGLTFARQLRAILRQDPDVLLIGEIRDAETADIAFRAAMTGHLVLSTLHCNEAAGAISRLLDIGVAPFLIASSLAGVVAQRLVPRLCLQCRRGYQPLPADAHLFDPQPTRLYEPGGCAQCYDMGIKGRIAIHEVMVCDEEMQSLIMDKADTRTLRSAAIRSGMTLMSDDGLGKVSQGLVHLPDVLFKTGLLKPQIAPILANV